MSRPKLHDRSVLDWARIRIPYKYDKTDAINYSSANNNPLKAYALDVQECKSLPYRVLNALGIDGYQFTNASMATVSKISEAKWGYSGTVVLGHIKLMYMDIKDHLPASQCEMGVCLELSSHALRDIENAKGFTNWFQWFQDFYTVFPNAVATRIDIAADFFHDLHQLTPLGLSRLGLGAYGRTLHTKTRKNQYIEDQDTAKKKRIGETYSFGKRTNNIYLRVYDKLQERIHEHGDSWLKDNRIKNWTRWEFELKNKAACDAVNQLLSGVPASQIWLDLVRRTCWVEANDKEKGNPVKAKKIAVQVFDPRNKVYKLKYKWVPNFWANFIDGDNVPSFDYSGKTPHWTYDRHMTWLGKSVLPSFTKDLLVELMQGGDANTYLNQIFQQSMSKLAPKDVDEIIKYSDALKTSNFKAQNNEFDFNKMLKTMSDRFTGMIAQRLYDLRNEAKFSEDDAKVREVEAYEDFIKEHGLENDLLKFKARNKLISTYHKPKTTYVRGDTVSDDLLKRGFETDD